ncbi:MAG: pilin [Candidatus Paceibacterota bacterium]
MNKTKFISNGARKMFLLSAIVLLVPFVAFAQGFVPLAGIPGLTEGVNTTASGLPAFFNNLYKYLIGLAAALAVIEIIWGGLQYSTQDSPGGKSGGKERIYQAIFGLVLVLSPVLVFSIINPSILNLSLNLPPLKTTSLTPSQMAEVNETKTQAATEKATTAGCTVTGTLLKTAICPTKQAAQDFATACPNGGGSVPFFTTDHKATCSTSGAGPFQFADTSTGWLATITGYSKYEPLASSGDTVLQFASACTADGGTTCMSTIKTPCASLILSGGSVSCWNISLSCTDGNSGAGGCSSNPQFTVIK